VEITTPEVTRALKLARQVPGIRSATIFGQSIHALIEDHFDLNELREELQKQGIVVAEIRPLRQPGRCVRELTYKETRLIAAKEAEAKRCVKCSADSAPYFIKRRCTYGRDFATIFFSLIIPLLQMLLLGYGIDTNIRQIKYRGVQTPMAAEEKPRVAGPSEKLRHVSRGALRK